MPDVRRACVTNPGGAEWVRARRGIFLNEAGAVRNSVADVQQELILENPFMRNTDMSGLSKAWSVFAQCLAGQGVSAGYLRALGDWPDLWPQAGGNILAILTNVWPGAGRDPVSLNAGGWVLELSVNTWRGRYVTWLKTAAGGWRGTTYDHPAGAVPGLAAEKRKRGVRLMLFRR